MADLRISELAALAGANLAAGDLLPIADVSASETKKITVTDLVGRATTLIADATIPSAKILFGANTIPGSSLTSSSVTATQLADDSVTAAKLADESSVDLVTTLPASGAFVGQIALDTDDSKIYCWNGSTWVTIKAAGSVNTVVGGTTGVVNVSVTASGDQVTINTTLDNTTQAAQFLAGPTAAAGTVGYRTIAGADLPTATTTTKGAVVVNGNGLTLSGDTIAINNSVTAQTSNFHVVQYDSKGLVTSGRLLTSSDVPLATASTVGVTKPGTGLNVTGAGTVNHTNAVAAGSGTKVSFDTEGHVTGTAALVESDIPDLSATKITTGTLDIGRIGTNAVIGSKLANFSVAKIGSTTPTAEHIGQFFFNPISRELSLWDGNVYQPVGISAGEIVFAGTYNAATNLLTSVTAEGVTAGFTNNAVLPAASALNNRHYVVVDNTGTGVSPAPAVALQPPDLLLSNGTSYRLIDVSQTVTAQTASTIVFTATGNITANDVQSAIVEVDSEKLAKAGDTLTGQLLISNTGSLVFEGATDNAFETTLGVVDPTADRTINLPNVSGTVVTTGDTGSVTSTMILDGTILNADVNASAAIAGTKISPDFGSQNVVTTGTSTAASFIPTSSTAPANGLYLPAANTVSISTASTERFRVDANGQLHAVSLGTAAAPTFSFVSDTNTGIYSPGADQVAISTGGSGRLFVDASGNVGINTSSPSIFGRLAIAGANNATAIQAFTPGNTSGLYFSLSDAGQQQIISYNAGVSLTTQGAQPIILNTNNTERLRITSAGLVGIGTSSPGGLLELSSNASGTLNGEVLLQRIRSNTSNTTFVDIKSRRHTAGTSWEGVGFRLQHQVDASPMGFLEFNSLNGGQDVAIGTGGATRVLVDALGRVGIGTTSPSVPLAVSAAASPQIQLTRPTGVDLRLNAHFANTDLASLSVVSNHPLAFHTNNTERLRITSAGLVGIGTTSPASPLEVVGLVRSSGASGNTGFGAFSGSAELSVGTNGTSSYIFSNSNIPLIFSTFGAERARIVSAGNFLVGASSSSGFGHQFQIRNDAGAVAQCFTSAASATGPYFNLSKSRGSAGSPTVVSNNDELGTFQFDGYSGAAGVYVPGARIQAFVDGEPDTSGDTTDMPGRLVFSTTADGASSPTERMRITNDGNVLINTTAKDVAFINGAGASFGPSGILEISTTAVQIKINRKATDGNLLEFFQDGTIEGSISVSGTTVSYNGAHLSRWSQLPSGAERTEILRGTVLSNIDEMCEWGDEENEQLNRMKVSDDEGDKNVSGVFQAWDDDDDTYTNDFYCAMTGDFIIRIGAGVTVERGDLLMSAGDGTAKPQDDDIIRSKTIAKVTSTNVTCTYEDGSYCVPCVLMAC